MMWRGLAVLVTLLASPPLYAQSLGNGDSKEPIAITADKLEVSQNAQEAVFSGNVKVVQGKVTLTSDRMTVHYRGAKDKQPGQNTVSRIDVDGNVFMATPEETAKGDSGVYYVDKKEIMLAGQVTLTKGKNVLKGTQLHYNMASGKSVFTGGGMGETKTSGGRVRALLIPEGGQ